MKHGNFFAGLSLVLCVLLVAVVVWLAFVYDDVARLQREASMARIELLDAQADLGSATRARWKAEQELRTTEALIDLVTGGGK